MRTSTLVEGERERAREREKEDNEDKTADYFISDRIPVYGNVCPL